jgi:hypothetical protein
MRKLIFSLAVASFALATVAGIGCKSAHKAAPAAPVVSECASCGH